MAKKTTTPAKPVGALSQRERERQMDEGASGRYRLRLAIDQFRADLTLQRQLKEVWHE
ncbi:hypothetical protein [Vreelandella indica]|uniref:hypothetical protein n=1 Tax=Vreelandella indica TaxID=3126500 RepID=UPI00300DC1E4